MTGQGANPISTVAVAGLGALGLRVARALDAGVPGLRLVAVSASTPQGASARVANFASKPRVLPLAELGAAADIIVECLPPDTFLTLARSVVARSGVIFIPASVAALMLNPDLLASAAACGCRVRIPSGAACGLDGLAAAREAGLLQVRLITRKPQLALGRQASQSLTPELVFAGSARAAVIRFPRNMNVAAAIALAGAGPDLTEVELWTDPALSCNRHELMVRSHAGTLHATAENLPDPDNPGSSMLAAFSIIALLRSLAETR